MISLTRRSVLAASAIAATACVQTPEPAPGTKPALFLIGDSTIRNGYRDNGETAGQFGWGHMMKYYFDTSRIHVVNDAMGGTSSKSYLESPTLWALVEPMIRPGDFVLVAFGHNDGPSTGTGNGDELQERTRKLNAEGKPDANGTPVTAQVQSFGWYMRQYVQKIRAKGATPIVLSLIPRNIWKEGKVTRNTPGYASWAREAAAQEGVMFVPLNDMIADKYDAIGKDKVTLDFFPPKEVVHPNWSGAAFNAACVADGIRKLDTPLKQYLVRAPKVPATPDVIPPAVGDMGPSARLPAERQ